MDCWRWGCWRWGCWRWGCWRWGCWRWGCCCCCYCCCSSCSFRRLGAAINRVIYNVKGVSVDEHMSYICIHNGYNDHTLHNFQYFKTMHSATLFMLDIINTVTFYCVYVMFLFPNIPLWYISYTIIAHYK